MPNNIVFSNPGGSVIRWGNGAATPYLTLSGLPSTGTVGVAVSGLVTNPSAATATWTVSSSPADAISTPSSGTLAPGVAVAFTLTALASGLKNVQLTSTTPNTIISGSPHSFTAASVAPPPPPPAPAASALTLSMASTGTTGAATLVTVTPNAAIGATGAATLSVSGGGTLGTSTLNFTAGSSAAQSTTLTRTTDGTTTLTMTNNMGLSNLGSPASYGSSSAASTGTPQPFTLTSASSGVLPFALGYAMSQGHVPAGQSLSFSGATAKLTVLSTWPDGSARHGIIAGTYTSAGSAVTVTPTVATVTAGTALTGVAVQTAMGANTAVFDAGAFGTATFSGADFATPFLTHAATDSFIEAIYRKQIGSDAHLVAWLSLRVWSSGAVEALPWVENGYIRVASPTSKSATYSFTLGGTSRFSAAIDLPARTRTPLVSGATLSYWLASDPGVTVKHDAAYLMATRLVPKYSATVSPSAVAVTGLPSTYTPLQLGSYTASMSDSGYQRAIGLLPEWDALYLTSTASSVWSALQRNAYSAGRWGIHYRDESTNRPLRFSTNPNVSVNSSSTADEPPVATGTAAGGWDIPHHPSVGYMAYLVTGRWYHMETVQFAATYNYLAQIDGGVSYARRNFADGILAPETGACNVRGAAWALRTLAQAATVTPDADTTLRAEFIASLQANINSAHAKYIAQANNPFGFVEPPGDTAYGTPSDGKVTIAPWQYDFYTAAIGYMLALDPPIGSTVRAKLVSFFAYAAGATVGRLGAASSATSWLYRDAATYTSVAALVDTPDWTTGTGPWPSSWRAMYEATYTTSPGAFAGGDLRGGNIPSATSYWGNLLPAIAYAIEHGVSGAAEAYSRIAVTPQFATLTTNLNTDCVWSVVAPTIAASAPAWLPAVGAAAAVSADTLVSSGAGWTGTSPGGDGAGYRNVITAWGGGVLNTVGVYRGGSFVPGQFLVLFGGGHNNYGGNELYAFGPLDSNTPTWSRINDPTIPAPQNVARSGGYPVSRHTYDTLVYLPDQNKMLCIGAPGYYSTGFAFNQADVFDFAANPASANPWTTADTSFPAYAGGGSGTINLVSGYDPATGKAWGLGKGNGQKIGAYTASAGTWASWNIDNPDAASDADGALDSVRSILVHLTDAGAVRAVDLRSTPAIYTPSTTGTGPGVSGPIEYDPNAGRFVMWPGSGNVVYFLTPSASPYSGGTAWAWSSATATGASLPAETTFGTYGRMRVASVGGAQLLLILPTETSSLYAYRLE